jgi:hypothetical protein
LNIALTPTPGIGAVFYVEHARHLFPHPGTATTDEEETLLAAMVPTVYFLVIFSIVVHGLSIPALDAFYRYKKIPPIVESEPTEVHIRSLNEALPNNAHGDVDMRRRSVIVHNRFSRPVSTYVGGERGGEELVMWNSFNSHETLRTQTEGDGHSVYDIKKPDDFAQREVDRRGFV